MYNIAVGEDDLKIVKRVLGFPTVSAMSEYSGDFRCALSFYLSIPFCLSWLTGFYHLLSVVLPDAVTAS